MIETDVEGSPTSVLALSAWLRDSLKVETAAAGDCAQEARQHSASSWEGRAASAYRAYARDIVLVSDDHTARIERAAKKVDGYASRLQQVQDRMREVRGEARGGGLSVVGTVIKAPPEAVSPGMPHRELSSQEQTQYDAAVTAYTEAVARIELYEELASQVTQAVSTFTQWIDAELQPTPKELEADASDVGEMMSFLEKNAGNMVIGFSLVAGERGLKKRATELDREAKRLRGLRRSGHPGKRSQGNAPETRGRINDLKKTRDWLGRGGKFLGPVGTAFELWNAYDRIQDGESPGKVVVSTGLGIAAGVAAGVAVAGLVVTAPAWGTALAVGAAATIVGVGVAWGAEKAWDALPDSFTDGVDDALTKGWEGTKGAVSKGWDKVTGWL
ncbi:hypothetical protein [Nocardioides sp.]|uniref:hypothetical protein n=1 Tax=Nocardioides sp. TaxID=35761 RepID=UPI0027348AC4|nr:hypothetical protein [Nocardioides sp.]MDP3893190.1 hypothetical protein [Nocardioides sp.]